MKRVLRTGAVAVVTSVALLIGAAGAASAAETWTQVYCDPTGYTYANSQGEEIHVHSSVGMSFTGSEFQLVKASVAASVSAD